MIVEDQLADDHLAASVWHVDRSARISQLVSGDPSAPRALVLVRAHGRNSGFGEIAGTDSTRARPRMGGGRWCRR